MNVLPAGKSVIVQSIGTASAWEFFQNHGAVLHRKTDLSGITHAVFVHQAELVETIPLVLDAMIVQLDQASIAKRALSDLPDERLIGVALMQAVAEGFAYSEAALFILSGPRDVRSVTVTFKPGQAKEVLGKSNHPNAVINTLVVRG
ncbi:hypothetical protein [Arthrobacter psychrochitiniphilus]|uniref:Uncharacterized protein n=1 Tax=Arthrobacter psychrochitiniphilus TaxID=291045 RepID=A0A2V3DM62_9MICC|nr:hypothetical protein [Arthrobacter psychrochitiniphilus]NYG16054.1 hypothetical protein [Arthrobacter psychrochitiniphilus]PXA64000.1 hypothetical protein CVS29_17250 [Arthrobacter psychrochitiniphilus]